MTDIFEWTPPKSERLLCLLENIHRPENASTRSSALVAVRHVLVLALGEKVPPLTYPVPAEDMPPDLVVTSDEWAHVPTGSVTTERLLAGEWQFKLTHHAPWTPCSDGVPSMPTDPFVQFRVRVPKKPAESTPINADETIELLHEQLRAAALNRPWTRLDRLRDSRIVDGSVWLYCAVDSDGNAKYLLAMDRELRELRKRDDAVYRFVAELHRRGPVGLLLEVMPTKETDHPE